MQWIEPHGRRRIWPALLAAVSVVQGCTAFSAVRSAEVQPGSSLDAGVTFATPPGDAAAWFWTYDCASQCDRSIPALDVALTHGVVPDGPGRPYELGVGLSGFYPYAHGYLQLRRGSRPFGVGGRLGVMPIGWWEGALFARYDFVRSRGFRVFLTPTLFVHAGNSPSGLNPGTFVAFAPGLGARLGAPPVTLTPSVLLILGRVDRRSGYRRTQDFAGFLVAGLSLRFGGAPAAPTR